MEETKSVDPAARRDRAIATRLFKIATHRSEVFYETVHVTHDDATASVFMDESTDWTERDGVLECWGGSAFGANGIEWRVHLHRNPSADVELFDLWLEKEQR